MKYVIEQAAYFGYSGDRVKGLIFCSIIDEVRELVAAIAKAVNEKGETIIFATQRGYGYLKGGWEFLGGKIEAGETP